MAVPKKRKSKSRTRQRRSQQDRVFPKQLRDCPDCGEPKLPHHACMSCGTYKDRQVLQVVDA
jgi:large subunit ribosomal protein L32